MRHPLEYCCCTSNQIVRDELKIIQLDSNDYLIGTVHEYVDIASTKLKPSRTKKAVLSKGFISVD